MGPAPSPGTVAVAVIGMDLASGVDMSVAKNKDGVIEIIPSPNTDKALPEHAGLVAGGDKEVTGRRADNRRMVFLRQPGAVTVEVCGHRYDPRNHPRHINCQHCWFTYFLIHAPQVKAGRAALASIGTSADMFGKKGDKFFRLFDSMVKAQLEKEMQQKAAHMQEAQPEQVAASGGN